MAVVAAPVWHAGLAHSPLVLRWGPVPLVFIVGLGNITLGLLLLPVIRVLLGRTRLAVALPIV